VAVRNYKRAITPLSLLLMKASTPNINKQLKSNHWMCTWEFCWYLSQWWVLTWRCPQYFAQSIFIRGSIFRVWSLETILLPSPSSPPTINFHDIFDYSKPLRTPILRGIVLWDIPSHLIHKTLIDLRHLSISLYQMEVYVGLEFWRSQTNLHPTYYLFKLTQQIYNI
jgi:hypothetical protein